MQSFDSMHQLWGPESLHMLVRIPLLLRVHNACTHVHVASSVRLQEAIQHDLMQRRLHVCPVDEGPILCRVQAAQLLVLQLQTCGTGVVDRREVPG